VAHIRLCDANDTKVAALDAAAARNRLVVVQPPSRWFNGRR
jgi:hypothetical protein